MSKKYTKRGKLRKFAVGFNINMSSSVTVEALNKAEAIKMVDSMTRSELEKNNDGWCIDVDVDEDEEDVEEETEE